MISLIYGGNFFLFSPRGVPFGHEEYDLEIIKRQFKFFGPFPPKIHEVVSEQTCMSIIYLMELVPQSETTPFSRITEREVCKKDKEFILKIMKMDWRDRPTAKELLEDEWFKEDGEE